VADLSEALAWVDAAPARQRRTWLLEEPLAGVRRRLESHGFAVHDTARPSAFGTRFTPRQRLDAYDRRRGIGLDVEWRQDPAVRPAIREVSLLDADLRYLVLARRWAVRRGGFAVAEHVASAVFDAPAARKLRLRGVLLVGI
jgi:hypothetical protein